MTFFDCLLWLKIKVVIVNCWSELYLQQRLHWSESYKGVVSTPTY